MSHCFSSHTIATMSKPKLLIISELENVLKGSPLFQKLKEMFDIITYYSTSEWDIPRDIFLQKLKGCSALICTSSQKIDKEVLDKSGRKLFVLTFTQFGPNFKKRFMVTMASLSFQVECPRLVFRICLII
uniref:Uncharacterized protein n=1 Tax=Cacopsylla melanoneura TaxID=428564 RepID=A0A8D8YNE7_9HEMI